MSIIEYIGSIGGIAGVFVVLIFFAYRHLVAQMRDDRKFIEDRQAGIIKEYNEAVKENTRVLAELFTWLKAKNGNR